MKFVAATTRYKIIVEEYGLLWRITFIAPGHTQVRFSNIFGSAADALREAEALAAFLLRNWGIAPDRPVRWEQHVLSHRAYEESREALLETVTGTDDRSK